MKTFKLLITIIIATLISCNNDNSSKNENKTVSIHECNHEEHQHHKKEEHFEKRTELKLNGNEKWVLNEATGIGMTKINELVSEFDTNCEDILIYNKLSENITEQTNYIIKKCDMTGEGHNQLHLLLNDFLPKIQKLAKSENIDEAKNLVNDISIDVETYFEYFISE